MSFTGLHGLPHGARGSRPARAASSRSTGRPAIQGRRLNAAA